MNPLLNRRVLVPGLAILALAGVFGMLRSKPRAQAIQSFTDSPRQTEVAKSGNSVSASVSSNAAPRALTDGKDLDTIRQWAHNELEAQRMVEENNRIIRRQLVTFKETPAAVIERCRLTGEPVRELTLPGLDGQSIQFEITKSDVEPSGLRGMFSGRIAGQPDSLVTLAFAKNKQAYTVLSPSAGIYLTADAHDSGDAILKSIQPDIYASGYCGNP